MVADRRKRKPEQEAVSFRLMMRGDLPQVFTIEAEAFAQPWSEADFCEVLDEPDSVALVAESSGRVVGYILVGWKCGWVRVLSCVVDARWRCRGIATRMIAPLIHAHAAGQCKGILVKVSERNLGAQLFFRANGFLAVRVLQGCLFDGQDVYVMVHSTLPPPEESEAYTWPQDELVPLWEDKHA